MTLQIVAVGDLDGRPRVWTVAPGEVPAPHDLHGDFRWRLSGPRTCIGKVGLEGQIPCPDARPVTEHAQCISCSGLEDLECVFEPRCQREGTTCHCAFGPEPHAVYIAFFGTLPKVGMTLSRRVPTRLREQGADAYFVLTRCPDRGTARSTERAVSFVHKIPEHRSHREILPQLARPVPWDGIESRAASLRLRLETDYDLERHTTRIEDHPIRQPLGAVPRRVTPWGLHEGTWLGAKGNNVLYADARPALEVGARPIAAVRRGDLVGRHVAFL